MTYISEQSSPPLRATGITTKSYQPGALEHFTVYYWKVVARDNHGGITESAILSFATLNHLPQLIFFTPPHMTAGFITPALSWSFNDPDPGDLITYDVYFGPSSSPPLVVSNQPATNYLPGTLSSFTPYYWKIVARDQHHPHCSGETSLPYILSFTTTSFPPSLLMMPFRRLTVHPGLTLSLLCAGLPLTQIRRYHYL